MKVTKTKFVRIREYVDGTIIINLKFPKTHITTKRFIDLKSGMIKLEKRRKD